MKRLTAGFLIAFFLISFGLSAAAEPAVTWTPLSDEARLERQAKAMEDADKIIQEKFTETYGICEEYEDRVRANGPFLFWSVEDKFWYSEMFPTLYQGEIRRMQTYHPDARFSVPFRYMILQWRYGLPAPGLISEEEAREEAFTLLTARYGFTGTDFEVAASLYTGHWERDPFPVPYWVFDFFDQDGRKAEIWINACSGDAPAHEGVQVKELGEKEFLKAIEEGYETTVDTVTDEMATILYFEDEHEWYLIFNPEGDHFWSIAFDDETLEETYRVAANG